LRLAHPARQAAISVRILQNTGADSWSLKKRTCFYTHTPLGYRSESESHTMKEKTKSLADQRLARIEGQVRAVRRLVAEDRYCVDVVRQVQAARSALASLEALVIEDHVDTCVEQALTKGSISERREKVTELVGILTGKKK
jgi:DNA-binding FrmR family transcriptional regulator